MKKLLGITTAATLLAVMVVAQQPAANVQADRQVAAQKKSQVMGKVVKGAPYSADEITESSQTLLDGTHISHSNQITVYRDSEGRVRRDTGNQITIWDPVANVSYSLDPQAKTAVKTKLTRIPDTGSVNITYANTYSATFNGQDVQLQLAEGTVKKMQAELQAAELLAVQKQADRAQPGWNSDTVIVNDAPANAEGIAKAKAELAATMDKLRSASAPPAKKESLGQQSFWGVQADGTRETTTLDAGAVGNDRPISIVSERWYSEDLQTTMMTKRTDPRTGEESFKLSNVRRGDPGAGLFLVPPGYTMIDRTLKQ
jgi:hypothetical protein